jgi:hypothetical protein
VERPIRGRSDSFPAHPDEGRVREVERDQSYELSLLIRITISRHFGHCVIRHSGSTGITVPHAGHVTEIIDQP